ncbi:BTAD domain-containing putative transcriptional regulator [Amycolatopsis taiwanensis]|uniref:SARP family transcriptional regulator n=1 Tax=Amycolatopsis taiwanensis TaxID=342230 RepID=A0A9W6R1H4_9PSEU|nr:BTAD domain-containing putative transcriptional regulator [Amycolatopsis taiwanensis]GLY66660.1 SARP family transcriptional regulator [Amycolatopsis taiwanensis]
MRFGVLGPLAVWTDRGEPVTVPGRKVRALLADLLVHGGRAVSVDRLVEDVWGAAPPSDPGAALHVRVSQLRRALAGAEPGGRDLVVSQSPGYALRTDAVDVVRFAALVEQADSAEPRARARLLAEALGLWRGPGLADFADEEFALAAVARWEEQRLTAVEAYAEARLALGDHRELVAELGEHVGLHPFRERLRAAHLRALHRSGRTGEALAGYQDLRRRLADELGLDPGPELTALHQALLAGDPAERAPDVAPPRAATNLPAPVTHIVGRDHAVATVRDLLTESRLVTLTGPGGVGKTSVALAVGRALADAYPDGVWLIDLTTWDGTTDLAELVLTALSIPDAAGGAAAQDRLTTALRARETLLLLDNCEHVIEPAAAMVGALLPAAPGVRVLATSREPLRLRGETRWGLAPLDVPDSDDPARLAQSPAVRLFLARAGLPADPATIAEVAEVCRRLDGIPLALELAATRVPALGVTELGARLRVPHDRFGVLGTGPRDAPERQRTLAAVIDWSWQLLTDAERTVLRRLSVHSGGCTLAAAEQVCADGVPSAVLDLLAGLVDRSLVVRAGGRYRLLESIAAYCHARLRDADEESALRQRHARHYLALAEEGARHLRGPGQRDWLRRLDAEVANLRAALETFRRDGAADDALRLAMALVWYWFLRGRLTEARRTLESALALPGKVRGRAVARAWAAGLAIRQGQAEPDTAVLDDIANPLEKARAAWFLASTVINFGDVAATEKLLTEALATFENEGDRWGEAAVLSTRAMLSHMAHDLVALERGARHSAELFGELGDDWGVLQANDWLIGLGDLTGERAGALRLCEQGLRIAEELELQAEVSGLHGWLAWLSVQAGDYARAEEHGALARRLAAEQGQQVGEVFATISVAFACRRAGRLDDADEHLRWLVRTARTQQSADSNPPYLWLVLVESGLLATQRGSPAALALVCKAFDLARAAGQQPAFALVGLAAALAADRPADAARLFGAAEAAAGGGLSDSDRAEYARIRATIAVPDFAALADEGRGLTPVEARALV